MEKKLDQQDQNTTEAEAQAVQPVDNQQLEQCRRECDDWKEKFVRSSADFENFRRRMTKEQAVWAEQSQSEVLIELLRIVDDVDRAIRHHSQGASSPEHAEIVKGLELVWQSLYKLLERFGVSEITDTTVFNPELHEAIAHVASEKHQSGAIVDIVQRGYQKGERVLRPTRVTVAK